MDDEIFELLRQEQMKAHDRLADAGPTNPFVLPQEAEIFGQREVEKQRRDMTRASLMQLSLVERADQQHPTVPPCPIKRPSVTQSAMAAHPPLTGSQRAVRIQRMTEFVHEKREMFLLQMIIDRQQSEIRKIQKTIADSERSAADEEENIEALAKQYKLTQSQLESQLSRVLRRAERVTQRRSDLQTRLKRAMGNVHMTRSSIIKNQESVTAYRQYQAFLDRLTPENLETALYFDRPSRMIERMDGFEEGNLMLIQTIRFYGEKIDEYDREFESATRESADKIVFIEDVLRRLPQIAEDESKLSSALVEKSRSQDEEYERLARHIKKVYTSCFRYAGDMSPLGMLLQLENGLEAFYGHIDRILPEFVAQKVAEREKKRREESRARKQVQQIAEQKQKMDHALARATKPIQLRTGRPLMPRTLPYQAKEGTDNAQLKLLREQERIEELLYGEGLT
jgi:hypothetical protein